MPFDGELSIEVASGTKPISWTSFRVSRAASGAALSDSHSIGIGKRFTRPKRRSTLSIIRSQMSLLSMPAVVAAQEFALRSQQSRGEHADSLTVVAGDLEAI